jgi:mannan endo-1,4-beta-mannosidase
MTFVTRSGTTLQLNGSQFNFSGANIYWLGLAEKPSVRYPTSYEVNDALDTAKEMGIKVVRAHTLGISTGNSLSVWPSLNTTNTSAFNSIDYAIYQAGLRGIFLIIPLTDNYHFYHGGKHNFTDWRSVAESTFYTGSNVISDFEAYINVILTRVNQYNGLAYKDDPTIMAWQIGNELSGPFPGSTWTTTMANYIKSVDSNHLIMDGSGTLYAYDSASLSVSNIDIMDDHYYPPLISLLNTDITNISAANKVYIAGEYGWCNYVNSLQSPSISLLASWFTAIESNASTIAGALFWDIYPHNDNYGWLTLNDGYAFHYPGATTDQITRSQMIRTHAYKQQGVTPAPAAGTITSVPIITSTTCAATNTVAWRGVAGAATYILQHAPNYDGPWTTVSNSATDFLTPYGDVGFGPYDTWYRVAAVNYDGSAGPYSVPQNATGGTYRRAW